MIKWSELKGDFKILMAEMDNTCEAGHCGELGELGSISKMELGKLRGRYAPFVPPRASIRGPFSFRLNYHFSFCNEIWIWRGDNE